MHSINSTVSFHSRLNSGFLLSGDNSKKPSRIYMDYLVKYYVVCPFVHDWSKITCSEWRQPGLCFSQLHVEIVEYYDKCIVCSICDVSQSIKSCCFAYKQTQASRAWCPNTEKMTVLSTIERKAFLLYHQFWRLKYKLLCFCAFGDLTLFCNAVILRGQWCFKVLEI